MTFATTILTTLAMLWHAMAGCCAHHVHDEAAPSHEQACHAFEMDAHVCLHHSHAADAHHEHHSAEESMPEHSHPHGMCDDTGCVFSMPDSTSQANDLSKSIGCQPYFDTGSLAAIAFGSYAFDSVQAGRVAQRAHTPAAMRRHLQLAVLLI